MNILVLNAGSSTLKFRLLTAGADEAELASGMVDSWGMPQAMLKVNIAGRPPLQQRVPAQTPADAAEHAIRACIPLGIDRLGHRVVHGGPHYEDPTHITREVVEGIREVSHLAPLHNQSALAGIEAGLRLLPEIPAFAVFDTAFHRTMPDVAALYALPREWAEQHHLRRYGFHGISHRFVSLRLLECLNREPAGTRLITCHLGNGASVCAIRDGKSVDTSMGFTPLAGLVMGTRSGDVDPGLVLHLINELHMTGEQVDELLNRRSGLLGLSGRSGDARELEAAAPADPRAELALACFAYRVSKYIGAYAAAMGGVDAIAFTGGIGEHSSAMRRRICVGLGFLGAHLDEEANGQVSSDQPRRISLSESSTGLWVIPTDEERQIVREILNCSESGF